MKPLWRIVLFSYSVHTHAGNLSGGNKQKVIVAREFSRPVKLLIANQPTRGIDVGSIEYIHSQIIRQRDAGSAVLLVSAELDETRCELRFVTTRTWSSSLSTT